MTLHYSLLPIKLFSILILLASFTPLYAATYQPKLTLTSDLSTLNKDQGTRIRWYARRASSCQAVGGWTNRTSPEDKHWVSSIDRSTTYTMTCTGAGGSVTKSITISRSDDNSDNETDIEAPSLTLISDLATLEKDQGTRIRWFASHADSCAAVGGWTDRTEANDKHWVSSIDRTTTYTMTCTGAGGSVTKSITISRSGDNSDNETDNEAPSLTLTSDLSTLENNQGTRIRWNATRATSCQAIGGWTDRTSPEDKHWVSSISQTTTYSMTCTGPGGSVTKSITLNLNGTTSDPAPTLTLSVDNATLTANASTTIRWNSENANSCSATAGWTNKSDVSGKQFIVSIPNTTTYRMTCTGNGGSVSKSITVSISGSTSSGSVELNWDAPITNQDGTALSDLAGYKVYYGTNQSNLNNVANVDAGLSSYTISNLTAGTYYFAISAIDSNDNESTRSNIAAKVVN